MKGIKELKICVRLPKKRVFCIVFDFDRLKECLRQALQVLKEFTKHYENET